MGVSVISIKVPVLQAEQEYTQDKRDRFNVSLPVDKVRGLTWGDKAATLYVEESDDGNTWVATKTTAIVAKTTADTGWVTLSKRYYRFRIKNGATTQGSIILYQQIVGMGSYLDMEEQAGIVVLDHGIPAANPVPVELKGSLVKVGVSDYSQTLNTPVGGKTVIEIRPPTGKLWRVKILRISTPSIVDATSGDHSIGIRVGRNKTDCEILYIKGKYEEWLSVLDNVVFAGTVAIRPATAECQQNAILNIAITNDAPLYLDYQNNTDADATGNIVVTINYEEETIA